MMRTRSTFVKAFSAAQMRKQNLDTLFMVWLVSRSTEDLLDTLLAPAGLSADEFAIYAVLTRSETLTPTELARWMSAPATTVSSYVKRLESRGHVVREPNPADGRSYRIRLTSAGRRAHKAAFTLYQPVRAKVADALSEKDPDVREALLRLRTVVDDVRNGISEPEGAVGDNDVAQPR